MFPPPLPKHWTRRGREWLSDSKVLLWLVVVALFLVLAWKKAHRIVAHVSDITLTSLGTEYGDFYLTAKVTNRGSQPLVLPVFDLGIDTDLQPHHMASGLIIAPGESAVLSCGGEAPPEKLRKARHGRVRFLYSDPFPPAEFVEEQLRIRPLLHLEVKALSHTDEWRLDLHFDNQSGRSISLIDATALFYDAAGALLDAQHFRYDPDQDYSRYGVRVHLLPKAKTATRCVVQIDTFREPGKQIPRSLPDGPSVY